MTDIVLFQLHFSHLPANRLDSLHEDKTIHSLCMCLYVQIWMFGPVWWTWMWMFMSCFRKLSMSLSNALLGCGGQSGRNNQGSHPVSLWPCLRCISNYCSQTHIRHKEELLSRGTWVGGEGAEMGSIGFLSEWGRDEMEGKWDIEASFYLPPSSWRPTRQGP